MTEDAQIKHYGKALKEFTIGEQFGVLCCFDLVMTADTATGHIKSLKEMGGKNGLRLVKILQGPSLKLRGQVFSNHRHNKIVIMWEKCASDGGISEKAMQQLQNFFSTKIA